VRTPRAATCVRTRRGVSDHLDQRAGSCLRLERGDAHVPVATSSIRAGPAAAQSAADASRIEHTHVHGAKWVGGALFVRRPRQGRRLRLDPVTLKGDNSDSGRLSPLSRWSAGQVGHTRSRGSRPRIGIKEDRHRRGVQNCTARRVTEGRVTATARLFLATHREALEELLRREEQT
jgi:hypothetical protein